MHHNSLTGPPLNWSWTQRLLRAKVCSRLGIYRGIAVAGCAPDEMGIGPVFAVPKLLKQHGLSVDDIGLWELNEAFAVQVIYCRDQLGIDNDKLNGKRRCDFDRASVWHEWIAHGWTRLD